MKPNTFNKIVNNRIKEIKSILKSKGKVYSENDDRLSNFKEGAFMNDTSPEEVLWGFVTKHLIALKNFIKNVENNEVPREEWEEKIGDIINYLILLEGLISERNIKYTFEEEKIEEG